MVGLMLLLLGLGVLLWVLASHANDGEAGFASDWASPDDGDAEPDPAWVGLGWDRRL